MAQGPRRNSGRGDRRKESEDRTKPGAQGATYASRASSSLYDEFLRNYGKTRLAVNPLSHVFLSLPSGRRGSEKPPDTSALHILAELPPACSCQGEAVKRTRPPAEPAPHPPRPSKLSVRDRQLDCGLSAPPRGVGKLSAKRDPSSARSTRAVPAGWPRTPGPIHFTGEDTTAGWRCLSRP